MLLSNDVIKLDIECKSFVLTVKALAKRKRCVESEREWGEDVGRRTIRSARELRPE